MHTSSINITAISYELGEDCCNYEELPQFFEQAKFFGMPLDATLWGWGHYHRTSKDLVYLILSCVRKTLSRSKISAHEVDAVIICAATFTNDIEDQKKITDTLMGELTLSNTPLFALTLNRCATLLNGLQLAYALVASKNYKNVLLIAADKIAKEEARFTRYGIFSDAAVSCLVSNFLYHECYELCEFVTVNELTGDRGLVNIGGELACKANEKLGTKLKKKVIHHIFHDNLFLPIVTLREQMAGFAFDQLFLSNIPRIGHCFTCDPLINLVDFEAQTPIVANNMLLLACSVPGMRIQVLLKKKILPLLNN